MTTHRPLRYQLDLLIHILLQLVRTLHIRRALRIVLAAIVEDQSRVVDEIFRGRVEILLVLFLHGAEIHGFLDDFVVVGHFVAVDGLHKGPGGAVVLHVVEEVEQLVVVGAVTRLAGELVHVRGPAG